MIQSTHLDQSTINGQGNIAELKKEPKTNISKESIGITEIKEESFKQKNSFTPRSVMNAIEVMNKDLAPSGKRLDYSIHERTKQIIIKVIDIQTDEVIKEIPDEKLIDMMADFCEASGILIDEKI